MKRQATASVIERYLSSRKSSNARAGKLSILRLVVRTQTGGISDDVYGYDWRAFDAEALRQIQQEMLDSGAQPVSVNVYSSTVRALMREVWREGLITNEHMAAIQGVSNVQAVGTRRPNRRIDGHVLKALYLVCGSDRTFAGRRDEALITLLYGAACKVGDIPRLVVTDLDLTNGMLKRQSHGSSYLSHSAMTCLAQYVNARSKALEERGGVALPDLVLAVTPEGDADYSRQLTDVAIRQALQSRCRQAGVPHLNPEDLRKAHLDEIEEALKYVQRQIQVPYVPQ